MVTEFLDRNKCHKIHKKVINWECHFNHIFQMKTNFLRNLSMKDQTFSGENNAKDKTLQIKSINIPNPKYNKNIIDTTQSRLSS